MRILHLPVGAGHQAWGLSRAERQLGHHSEVVIFEQNRYLMKSDQVLFSSNDSLAACELKRWSFFLKSVLQYDVFHFHFNQKFFNLFPRPFKKGDTIDTATLRLAYWTYSQIAQYLDVAVIALLGKKIFMTYHGDDLRQGDRSQTLYRYSIASEVGEDYYDDYSDKRKRRSLTYYQKHCDGIYVVSSDLLDMGGGGLKWIGYTGVDHRQIAASPTFIRAGKRLKLVHAPTHRLAKGTRFIEAAIETLKNEGFEFDFRLIEDLPHSEAMAIYRDADLVIDQLLAGWFGVFALELMAMGKPVVCYIRDEAKSRLSVEYQETMPIINATPDNITDVLREILIDPESLNDIGPKGRKFAEEFHDPLKIAESVLHDYESAQ